MNIGRIVSAIANLKRPMKTSAEAKAVLKSVTFGAVLGTACSIWFWLNTTIPRSRIDPSLEIGEYLAMLLALIPMSAGMGALLLLSVQRLLLRLFRPKSIYSRTALLFTKDFLRGAAVVIVIVLAIVFCAILVALGIGVYGIFTLKDVLFIFINASLSAPSAPAFWVSGLCIALWKLLHREGIESNSMGQTDGDTAHRLGNALVMESLKAGALSAVALLVVSAIGAQDPTIYGVGYVVLINGAVFLVPAFFFGALGPLFGSYFDSVLVRKMIRYFFLIYGAMTPKLLELLR